VLNGKPLMYRIGFAGRIRRRFAAGAAQEALISSPLANLLSPRLTIRVPADFLFSLS